jgi:hypothetical protein
MTVARRQETAFAPVGVGTTRRTDAAASHGKLGVSPPGAAERPTGSTRRRPAVVFVPERDSPAHELEPPVNIEPIF